MEKERGLEERQATPVLQECPQLQRLALCSLTHQGLLADYLAYLRARHYTPSVQEGMIRALKSVAVLMPAARQPILYEDRTQPTPTDINAWIDASFRHQLAPGTVATRLRVVQGFLRFLRAQGYVPQSPMRPPRHPILVPQALPHPMAEAEVVALFRVMDALRDRTMFLLMWRGGLRVGEVSSLPWSVIDLVQGTVRIDSSKGHVDRGVYLAPDVAKALRQWQRHQAAAAQFVFPSRGASLTARQSRDLMTGSLQLAGIPKAYSPHSLRHTFAPQLLHAGASLEVVKELRGHHSLDMTLRYIQLYDRTKRAPYDQAMTQVEKPQGI